MLGGEASAGMPISGHRNAWGCPQIKKPSTEETNIRALATIILYGEVIAVYIFRFFLIKKGLYPCKSCFDSVHHTTQGMFKYIQEKIGGPLNIELFSMLLR